MTSRSFTLQPFPGTGPRFPLQITGVIARQGTSLTLRYTLRGNLAAVALPGPAARPARRHGLWAETCLEFFLAPENSPRYWEFNLSPAGPWNAYTFQGYRQGMQEESAFAALPFTVQQDPTSLALAVEVDLAGLIPAAQLLEAAISADFKDQDGETTYWALTHPGPQPDFHRREAFLIKL